MANLDVDIRLATGSDLRESDWDAFFRFYTTRPTENGAPLFEPGVFSLLGERMADRVLLVLAGIPRPAVAAPSI